MEIEISGLKCDNCVYRDDDVKFSEYKNSIGRKCPKCGESLLTEKDYQKCLTEYKIIGKLNKINNILRWINPFFLWRKLWGYKSKQHSIEIEYRTKKKNHDQIN